MAYRTTTISEIVGKIFRRSLCLPVIQRKYVWDSDKIENLFDSIYRGYPIGTFLIWDIPRASLGDYYFYNFLENYDEFEGNVNRMIAQPILIHHGEGNENIQFQSVLDGQQRLTSIYVALQGYYKTRNTGGRINNPLSYTSRRLHFNLTGFNQNLNDEEEENSPLFRMLSESEMRADTINAWQPINTFINDSWRQYLSNPNANETILVRIIEEHVNYECTLSAVMNDGTMQRQLFRHIEQLLKRIHSDEIISFYEIRDQVNLSEVTEIFIRINSGGKVLSKSDLLFSTVVSKWQDGREKVDDLIATVKELGYEIDTDFVMRTALYLTHSPILFRVDNFQVENIDRIIDCFYREGDEMDIRKSILKTFEYLRNELKISEKTLKSKNVLIPIIFHLFKGGLLGRNSLNEVKKYIYISLLQKVFGSHGDSLLSQLRDGMLQNNGNNPAYVLQGLPFNYTRIISGITDQRKRRLYDITHQIIEDFLDKKKGDESWLVLSLIYEGLQHQYASYDQDHLHPRSKFIERNFPNQDFELIENRRDTVPNLCFATEEDNRLNKRGKLLQDYIENILPANNVQWYKSFNFIDDNMPLNITEFNDFYERRREKLKRKLFEKLNGPQDAGPQDAGPQDAGPQDAGPQDAGPQDAGLQDAGPLIGINFAHLNYRVTGEGNTTSCYNEFMKYVIDNYTHFIADSIILRNRFKDRADHPDFGQAIRYNRIISWNRWHFHTYQDSKSKIKIMLEIANLLNQRIDFLYH